MTIILKIKTRPVQTYFFPDETTAVEVRTALEIKHPELEYELIDSGENIEDIIAETVVGDPIMAYVLMRTDVPNYMSGKAMAQSNHAGTAMVKRGHSKMDATLTHLMSSWEKEGDGFGTCIVLKVTAPEMRQAVSLAKLMGVHAGIVHDPSYPIYDGERIQTIPLDTCAYVFGRKSDCYPIVGRFPLLRGPGE